MVANFKLKIKPNSAVLCSKSEQVPNFFQPQQATLVDKRSIPD